MKNNLLKAGLILNRITAAADRSALKEIQEEINWLQNELIRLYEIEEATNGGK